MRNMLLHICSAGALLVWNIGDMLLYLVTRI